MSKKVELSAEERVQLVLRMLSKEEPVVQIARRAGIAEQTLYRWRDEFINAGKQALNGGGTRPPLPHHGWNGSQQQFFVKKAAGALVKHSHKIRSAVNNYSSILSEKQQVERQDICWVQSVL